MTATSGTLLIRGDASADKISSLSSFTAHIIDSASFAGVRTVFCFCTFRSRSVEDRPVLTLVQDLISQLLQQQAEEFTTPKDLSEQRFQAAKGSFSGSWDLFEDLMALETRESIVVALDCLECLEADLDAARLVEKVLPLSSKGKIKILLTTKRSTARLFTMIPEADVLRLRISDTRNSAREIRRPYRGSGFEKRGAEQWET
jgi:hypothetical protein